MTNILNNRHAIIASSSSADQELQRIHPNALLMQDKAPNHISQRQTAHLAAQDVIIPGQPGGGSDFNPIEYWCLLKDRVAARRTYVYGEEEPICPCHSRVFELAAVRKRSSAIRLHSNGFFVFSILNAHSTQSFPADPGPLGLSKLYPVGSRPALFLLLVLDAKFWCLRHHWFSHQDLSSAYPATQHRFDVSSLC